MAYKAMLNNGNTITIADAVRSEKTGNGTYFYNADGAEVASFGDGVVTGSYPADSNVEAPSNDEAK